ncbi:MAG: DUF1444 family protein [Ascidiaceihabitans sp.]|nr:DUF1444 family protein [Ascidiaceihabitans sp.]
MRLLWAAIVTLILATPVVADIAAPKNVDETLVLMRDQLSANTLITDIVVDFDESYIKFQFDGTGPHISFPDNLHSLLSNAGTDAERSEILATYLQNIAAGAAGSQLDAPINVQNVYPVIRHQSLGLMPTNLHADPDQNAPPEGGSDDQDYTLASSPFAADMRVYLVEDTPRTIKFITQDMLVSQKLSAQSLKQQAVKNLRELTQDLEVRSQDDLHMLAYDSNFETSFLMDDEYWDDLETQSGPIVAVVAARDLVLFVNGNDAKAVTDLRDLVHPSVNLFSYPVSTALITRKDGRWQAYD